jgi:hypothetical protein
MEYERLKYFETTSLSKFGLKAEVRLQARKNNFNTYGCTLFGTVLT